MGDWVDRVESDRALFQPGTREQLANVLARADRRLLTKVIVKLIELQLVTEEVARENGIDINGQRLAEYIDKNRSYVNDQVDRAITSFISSIVSQEG